MDLTPYIFDIISLLATFSAGIGCGYFLHRPTTIVRPSAVVERVVTSAEGPIIKQPSRHVSPGRRVVIFRFADGLEQTKTLFEHSCESALLWKDRLFAMEPGSDVVNGHTIIYNEVEG